MKNLLLILFFVNTPYLLMSSVKIDGAMGIKFGSNREQVKQEMAKKPDYILDEKNCDINNLFYKNGRFAGRDVEYLLLTFVDNKFQGAAIFFRAHLESEVIDDYNSIRDDLNQKYYVTEVIKEEYKYPYEAGDGFTETAIKQGKAKFLSVWKFESSINSEYNSSIILSISEDLKIILIYQEGTLGNIASEREKNKIMSDY